jgi:hypothetical protein
LIKGAKTKRKRGGSKSFMTKSKGSFAKIKVSNLHNNLDATKAKEQGIERVWSVWPCAFFKAIKRNIRAKPDEFNTRYSIMKFSVLSAL